jgi:hypothetical protein
MLDAFNAGSDFGDFSELPHPEVPIARAMMPAVAISDCFNKKFITSDLFMLNCFFIQGVQKYKLLLMK